MQLREQNRRGLSEGSAYIAAKEAPAAAPTGRAPGDRQGDALILQDEPFPEPWEASSQRARASAADFDALVDACDQLAAHLGVQPAPRHDIEALVTDVLIGKSLVAALPGVPRWVERRAAEERRRVAALRGLSR